LQEKNAFVNRIVEEYVVANRLLGPMNAIHWGLGAVLSAPAVLRARSLGKADEFLGTSFTVRYGGRQLRLCDADFGVCREILGHDCYRLVSCRGQLRTAIDLGANCGIFTLMAALLNPECRILAVEANPDLAVAAAANAERNAFSSRVAVVNQLVGDATVQSIRELIAGNPSIGTFDPREAVRRLGECDFLKCDVEGGEHELFTGDLSWLEGVRRFAIEYHWTEADGVRLAGILAGEGFEVERQARRNLGYLFGVRRP